MKYVVFHYSTSTTCFVKTFCSQIAHDKTIQNHQAARQSSAARDAITRLERCDYFWWSVLTTVECTLFLLIGMEVQWRVTDVCGCSIQAVQLPAVFGAVTPVADRYCSFLLSSHSIHYYTLYFTTEGRGEKVVCVAASALHRVPVLFLPCSQPAISLPVLLYTSMYVFFD